MMKYISYITFILCLSLPAAHAEVHQPKSWSMWHKIASLFHTDDNEDTDTLPALLDANKTTHKHNHDNDNEQNMTPNIQGAYYLSSIIYTNNKNWSIWLNDQIIKPAQMHQLSYISLKRVSADKIECTINDQEKTFVLCPNQTLDLSNGHIVNGDQRKSILAVPEEDDDFALNEAP